MKLIDLTILVLMLVISTINSNAQSIDNQQKSTAADTQVNTLDSLRANLADTLKTTLSDSIPVDNLDNILSDKLDSMVHTWYVQNAFPVDSLEKAFASDTLQHELPDSVYISRLQNLDSYISLPFNESVKKFINFYVNRRKGMVSIMMGLTNYYLVGSFTYSFNAITAGNPWSISVMNMLSFTTGVYKITGANAFKFTVVRIA